MEFGNTIESEIMMKEQHDMHSSSGTSYEEINEVLNVCQQGPNSEAQLMPIIDKNSFGQNLRRSLAQPQL